MGPTNIDMAVIGSCLRYPTSVVDTDSVRRLRESTRMKMVNQVKRSKIAYRPRNYGGYAAGLRRLCVIKARDRSVPDGSDNESDQIFSSNICHLK